MKRLAVLVSALAALGILACASGDSGAAASRRGLEVEALSVVAADIAVFPQLGHPNEVSSVVFSPDGKYIASTGGRDFAIKVWEIESEKEFRTLLPFQRPQVIRDNRGYLFYWGRRRL
jgi:WD40 repeat protein